jgi:hypothetical protein
MLQEGSGRLLLVLPRCVRQCLLLHGRKLLEGCCHVDVVLRGCKPCS